MAKGICHVLTSMFKSLCFQIFTKIYCRKIMEDTLVEIVPDESKLIYAINIFIPRTSKKLRGYWFGLSVPIRPYVTLFYAYHACKGFEIS